MADDYRGARQEFSFPKGGQESAPEPSPEEHAKMAAALRKQQRFLLFIGLPAPMVWGGCVAGLSTTARGRLFGVTRVEAAALERGESPPWRRFDADHQYFRIVGRALEDRAAAIADRRSERAGGGTR